MMVNSISIIKDRSMKITCPKCKNVNIILCKSEEQAMFMLGEYSILNCKCGHVSRVRLTKVEQLSYGGNYRMSMQIDKEKSSISKSIVENDKDLLNEHTVAVGGGRIEVYNHESDMSNRITIEYSTYYDEKEPALITMSVHQCELLIELMKNRLEEIK